MAGCTRSTSKKPRVTLEPMTRSGAPSPVRLKPEPRSSYAAMDSNVRVWSRHITNFGTDCDPFEPSWKSRTIW